MTDPHNPHKNPPDIDVNVVDDAASPPPPKKAKVVGPIDKHFFSARVKQENDIKFVKKHTPTYHDGGEVVGIKYNFAKALEHRGAMETAAGRKGNGKPPRNPRSSLNIIMISLLSK
jgi:hypothetical protein